jgi:hypothetical protein
MMKNSTPTMAMDDTMLVRGVEAGTADMGKLLRMRETDRAAWRLRGNNVVTYMVCC